MHKNAKEMEIWKSVRQIDTISPKLFTAVLKNKIKKLTKSNIDVEYLIRLRFVDIRHNIQEWKNK